jgi:hypothetical protein
MASVAELEARLEALKAQRDSAVARVSYDGRSAESRGSAEIARAIADLERELQGLQGSTPVRQIRVYASKGLCRAASRSGAIPTGWCGRRTPGRYEWGRRPPEHQASSARQWNGLSQASYTTYERARHAP